MNWVGLLIFLLVMVVLIAYAFTHSGEYYQKPLNKVRAITKYSLEEYKRKKAERDMLTHIGVNCPYINLYFWQCVTCGKIHERRWQARRCAHKDSGFKHGKQLRMEMKARERTRKFYERRRATHENN